jgi:hypothetical protein
MANGATSLPEVRSLLMRLIAQQNRVVSAEEIDRYLDALEEPKRTTLARLRQTILDILPGAEQGISYGVPAFKVRGKTIAGFAAFKNHLSYLPHSGSVFRSSKMSSRVTQPRQELCTSVSPSRSRFRWSRSSSQCGSSRPSRLEALHRIRPAASRNPGHWERAIEVASSGYADPVAVAGHGPCRCPAAMM